MGVPLVLVHNSKNTLDYHLWKEINQRKQDNKPEKEGNISKKEESNKRKDS